MKRNWNERRIMARENIFANSCRGVPGISGTPVETRHFGPAPIGLVARREKAMKRIQSTNGNIVLGLPVPPKLVLSCPGHLK
jgi:hypothetical protein